MTGAIADAAGDVRSSPATWASAAPNSAALAKRSAGSEPGHGTDDRFERRRHHRARRR